MRQITWEVVDGKARYNGRGLTEWVSVAVADLVVAADPLRIVLFGSVARGDDGPDSDLDLLVVLPTLDQAQRHLLMANLHSAVSAPVPGGHPRHRSTGDRAAQGRHRLVPLLAHARRSGGV
ncbi:MAG: nucleotidyltransferase domain-containing protein [Egibacteraceae bacterium]